MPNAELIESLKEFLLIHGIYLFIFIILLIVIGMIWSYISKLLLYMRKKEGKYLDMDTIDFLETFVKILILIGLIVGVIYIISRVYFVVDEYIWMPLFLYLPSIIGIIVVSFVTILTAKVLRRFMKYLRGHLEEKPTKVVSPRTITIIEVLIVYAIYVIGFLVVLVIGLAAIGLYDIIIQGTINFLTSSIAYITFIIVTLFIFYFAAKLTDSFFEDFKGKSKRLTPQMIDVTKSFARYIIYFIAGIIVVFALLSMFGLKEMGTTILTLATLGISFIIAMAATGSIGNAISGMILLSTRPYDVGERIRVMDGLICDVIEMHILYTRVRDLYGHAHEIPNNTILSYPIVNMSRSECVGICIKTSIGYDVPNEVVVALMKEAADKTSNLRRDLSTEVFAVSLDNYAIEYELVAYVEDVKKIKETKSELIMNCQKTFHENNVEILSPMYIVKREDGGLVDKWREGRASGKNKGS